MMPLKEDLIQYKLEKAEESLDEARILTKEAHWNTVANRLYYAVYYAVNALLISLDLKFKTHSGVKSLFHYHFIKNSKMDEVHGNLFNALFNLRQIGDYEAFQKFSKEDIEPYIYRTEVFLELVKRFLQKNET